jgi:hypothetical protein
MRLSSIVPLEERERAPCAFKEEFGLTPRFKFAQFFIPDLTDRRNP